MEITAWAQEHFQKTTVCEQRLLLNPQIKVYVCRNEKTTWTIKAQAQLNSCGYYSLKEASLRASLLIGKPTSMFTSSHVISHAISAYAYNKRNCEWYLKNIKDTDKAKFGVLIVGKDGKQCGILDNEGDKFIYGNEIKKQIVSVPLALASSVFPKGFVYKDYSC